MKKLSIICILLALFLLAACGHQEKTPEVIRVSPDPTPILMPTAEPEPVSTAQVLPTPVPVPTQIPTPIPTVPPTPVPTPLPTPAAAPVQLPAQSNLPRITKDPTDETVPVNGKCQFVTRYENADLAEWHFVSPDNSLDVSYQAVQNQFPSLKIIGGNTKDMTLEGIPQALNGCRVYCRFSNSAGSVNTASALITVTPAAPYNVPPVQREGFEGRWAEEIAGRCQVYVTNRADGGIDVDISWSGSAWQRSRWQMTANVYQNGVPTYDDGHAWVETYTDDYNYTISDETFGGTGSFYMQDGKLHWYNDQTGQLTVFVPA